jgi:hypothetical protein
MISLYAPHAPMGKPYKVYTPNEFHGDGWDPFQYARSYDLGRSFFEQFAELQHDVPRLGLVAYNNENCPYTTGTAFCKNCHLITCSENSENCYYGKLYQNCRDCMDCTSAYSSELCYECFGIRNCWGCAFLTLSENCMDCFFSENLIGCKNCLFCTNLRQAEYCIFNRRVTKNEFQEQTQSLLSSRKKINSAKVEWQRIRRERIHKYANIMSCENSSGDFLSHCKNVLDSYDVVDSEDCRYVQVGVNVKDMYDCSNVFLKQELGYQMLGTIDAYHCAFSTFVFHSQYILYSDHIWNSKNLFGCVGLRRAENCVLNKQYSQEEYDKLLVEIINSMKNLGEWGIFLPPKYAPFCYNETLAQEYVALNKDNVMKRGWHWRDEEPTYKQEDSAPTVVPSSIDEVDDSISSHILVCERSKRPYKIMPVELAYYRRQRIAPPFLAPLERHYDREALRNPRVINNRPCDKCGTNMLSNFDPHCPEIVYCEDCFQRNYE